jgi:hypothetical protein
VLATRLAVLATVITVVLICAVGLTLALLGGLYIMPISLWGGFACASLLPAVFGVLVAIPAGSWTYRWLTPSVPPGHGEAEGNNDEVDNV